MIETPTDWYYRSRNELLKSVLDGHDWLNSLGEYKFAKMNLEAHNEIIPQTTLDDITNSILKAANEQTFERGAEMRLGSHPWQNRVRERVLHEVAASYPHVEFAQGQHFAESHPHHPKHHPLRQKNTITGRSKMIEKLRQFYLPSAPGERSLSYDYKMAERGKEQLERKNENPSVIGKKRFDTNENKEVEHHNFLGPLNDHYLHDIYYDNFLEWQRNNPDTVKEMIEKFPKPEEHEHALQLKHFEEFADSLESDQNHGTLYDPKENLTEAEIQEITYSGDFESLTPFPIKEGLGYDGYLYGLEFLPPIDRFKVLKHLHEKGTDAHDAQTIQLSNGKTISAGRIKRNLAQRFTGEFDRYMRPQHMHGANVKKHYETIDDDPRDSDRVMKQSLLDAMRLVPHEEGSTISVYDKLLEQYNTMLNNHRDEGTESSLTHLPIRGMMQGRKINKGAIQHPTSHGEGILQELQTLDDDPFTFTDLNTMLGLLGYNSDMTAMDNHPLLLDFENPLVDHDKVKEIIMKAQDMSQVYQQQKPIRNHDFFHHGGKNGPDINDIPEEEREHYLTDDEGNIIGLGAHFADEFHHQGGMGRNVLHYLEMMHDSLPKDNNGYSIIGRVDGGELIPNPKTVGLWGRYLPSLFSKDSGTHQGPHGISSLWDSSSHIRTKPRNNKNLPHRQMSSLIGGYTNLVRYMTDNERKQYFSVGQSNRGELGGRNFFTTNPINAIGGKGGKATQTINNQIHSGRLITSGGRYHPPHEPMKKKQRLGRKDIRADSKLAHSEGNLTTYRTIQGHKKLAGKDLPLTNQQQQQIDELDQKYDEISNIIMNFEEGSEEYGNLNFQLHDIEGKIEEINNQAAKENKNSYNQISDNAQIKDEKDHEAIMIMAKKLRPEFLKKDPDAFNPEMPDKFLANTSRLMRDANMALLRLPHSVHGLFTHGYGEYEDVHQSAAELLTDDEDEVVSPHHTIASVLGNAGKLIEPTMSLAKVRELLNLPDDDAHNDMIERLLEGRMSPVKVLKHGDLLGTGVSFAGEEANSMFTTDDHHSVINGILDEHISSRPHHTDYSRRASADKKFGRNLGEKYAKHLGLIDRLFRPNQQNQLDMHGLSRVQLSHRDGEYGTGKNALGATTGDIDGPVNRAKSLVHDLYLFDSQEAQTMDKVVAPATKVKLAGYRSQPIHPATSTGASVQDMYISGGMDSGYPMTPSVGMEFPGNKKAVAGTNTEEQFLHSIPEEVMNDLHGEEAVQQVLSSNYQVPVNTTNMSRTNVMALPANSDMSLFTASDPTETLTVLMNPEALLKEDKSKPPPILPMHRIFSLKDFDALRGFSGDWVVSSFYDGERMIITRKSNKVSAYDESNDNVMLTTDDKKHLKALTEKNFMVDAVRMKNNIHLIDILEYDGTNIADMTVKERLKVLRGQFDSHEHVLVPSPFDTRITEDGGLKSTVENLQNEHKQLLLRDANSTYMRGERRHPKWFLLRKNKNVSFIILDVRGKGPYIYRLGAGPLDSEGFGNRGVDYEGKQYLDVGTIKSPKPFNEGDTVSISVSGVKKRNRNGKTLYDVTSSKIVGEAEAESPASLETLSLLAKSHPVIPVVYDIVLKENEISVVFEGLDEVVYKAESSHTGNWVHSPKSIIGELSHSDYTLQLAESVRPLWSQAVSLMLKGVDKKKDSVVEEIIPQPTYHSMHDKKNREHSEEQSHGIIDADDEKNLLKVKMLKTLSRIADFSDRIDALQKEKMSGGPGARGMGINVGSAIESPRGPTSLTSEESVPDWDMIERPTEDPEEEYPIAMMRRLKQKNAKQSPTYEAESDYEA